MKKLEYNPSPSSWAPYMVVRSRMKVVVRVMSRRLLSSVCPNLVLERMGEAV
jgi:hypothetical protein